MRAESWMAAHAGCKPVACEESPDSKKQRCRVTPGRSNPTESATEMKPPSLGAERVKRWGKSPPQPWQQGWHGKPHREQCRIGIASTGRFTSAIRVGSLSLRAIGGLEEWSSRGSIPSDKIRLTGSPRVLPRANFRSLRQDHATHRGVNLLAPRRNMGIARVNEASFMRL